MLPKATLDPADARRAARLGILILLLLGLVSLATAGAFDTPITAADFDTANFSQYVDGNTTQITSLTPSDIVWTTTTSPPDSKQLVFGNTNNPGTRHARVAFSTARTVGAILVRGDVQVSILKSSATYPGSLSSDADWTVCERLTGKTVANSQVNLVGVSSQYPGYALWVVPSAATATRAIRFTRTAPRSDTTYAGHVCGVYVLADRFANLAPQAASAASLNPSTVAATIDELADTGWDSGTPSPAISTTNPALLYVIWPSAVSLRGLCGLGAKFASADVAYYSGPASTNPREASEAGWTAIGTWAGAQQWPGKYLGPSYFDFGSTITTRAVRIKLSTPTTVGGSVAFTDLQALKAMGTSALSTAALANTLTNPPIPITFTLAAAGYVTLVIDDSTGKRVRNLVEAQYFPAGSNTVYWDGIDESMKYDELLWGYHTAGKLVAPGTYTARGLVRNALTLTYEFSVNTGGNPPWFNRDETGGWLADHTPPTATLFLPGSQEILISSPVAEQGNGLAWTNLTGQLVYGTRSLGEGGYWHGADLLARDTGGSPESGIAAYFVDHGGSSTMELWAVTTGKGGGKRYGYSYPDGTTIDATRPRFGGLAVRNQLAAVSLSQTDQVVLLRVTDGHVYNTVSVANARGLAFDSNGKLVVLSGTSVVRYDVPAAADGMTPSNATTLVTGLADPRGLTLDSNNDMYISDWGTSNQVKVYTSAGSFVRVIGTANSGVTAGAYDATKMVNPTGVTISDNAGTKRLWVAENNYFPKRISVWTLTGTLDTAYYGPSSWGCGPTIDPQDKTRCYNVGWDLASGMEFALNWTNGTFSLSRIYYVPPTNGTVALPGSAPQTPIYANGGQQYMTNDLNTSPSGGIEVAGVWQMRNNIAVPVAAVGNAHAWTLIKESQYDSVWSSYGISKSTADPVLFAWTDTDNDQQVDASELTLKLFSSGMYTGGVSYDYDLSVVTRGGIQLACGGFTAAGAPLYNAANAANAVTVTYNGGVADGGCQVFEAANNRVVATTSPITGWQNGTQQWTYPNEWMGMEAEARWNMPLGQSGDIMALMHNSGQPVVANSDIGEIFAINSAEGQTYLMTTDGLFIDTLFKDRRTIPTWNWYKLSSWGCLTGQRGMDVTNVSNGVSTFFTTFNKTIDGNFYIFGGLEHDSIVRVDGVSTMARIAPIDVMVSNTTHTACADYQITHEQERQQQGIGREMLTIAQPQEPVIDGTVGPTEYSDWMDIYTSWPGNQDWTCTYSAALAVDSTKLYCALKNVTLTNSGTDLPHLFRTGGGVVIHLGTNAAADPTRTTPVAGDLRLVVSQVGSTVKAMLYKQVATGGTSHNYANSVRTVTMQDVQDVSSQVTLSGAEFSIPLSVLGFTPATGNLYLGDVGILFPKNSNTETYRGEYYNSQAQGVLYDEPYEVQCYPQTWGRCVIGPHLDVDITAPTDNTQYAEGATVTLTAAPSSDLASIMSRMDFYANGVLLGYATSSPYTITWTIPTGGYAITAVATDTSGRTFSSRPISISTNSVIPQLGLRMFLHADVMQGMTNGQAVSRVLDSSGWGKNATQATTSKQPQFITNGANGRPVLRFDGSDDYLAFPAMTDIRTVFWAVKEDADATATYRHLLGGISSMTNFHRGTGVNPKMLWGNWTNATITGGVTRLNGTAIDGTTTLAPTSLSYLALRTTGNAFGENFSNDRDLTDRVWDGDLADLIIYNRALTDTEISTVEAYLAAKYNLTSTATKAGPPHAYPGSGRYTASQSVTLSCEQGATIRYTMTTDGSEPADPTSSSTPYSGAITVNAATTKIKARSFKSGKTDSDVVRSVYTIGALALPFTDDFNDSMLDNSWTSLAGGTWRETAGVLQQSDTGSSNKRMILSNTGITLPATLQITAKVRVESWTASDDNCRAGVAVRADAGTGSGYAMIFHDVSGERRVQFLDDGVAWGPSYSFNWIQGVWYWFRLKIENNVLYGKVWQDGSTEPTTWPYSWTLTGNPRTGFPALYCGAANCKVAFDDVTVTDQVATPTFSPAGGTYATAQTVTISCATNGATIRYTTDGSDPTSESTLYTGSPLNIGSTTMVKAKAFKSGTIDGAIVAETYEIATNAVFADNFTDGAVDSHWTFYQGTWAESGGILQQTDTQVVDPKRAIVTNITVPSPVQITAKVRVDGWADSTYSRAGIGLCTSTSNGQGYNLIFYNNHNTVQFLDDGVAWGPSYTFAWQSGVWYWFKLKYENGTLYGKVWADGSAEPASWPYSWARSGRTGYPALNGGAYNLVSFDQVTVSDLNQAPTCSLTSPAADASFVVPATVSLTANASDSDGTISKVEFYQGSTLLGTDSTSPYSYSWINMAAGTYSLMAKAYDNSTGVTTSGTVSVTVNPAGTLFFDNFNNGSLDAKWTLKNGTWTESGGTLSQSSTTTIDPKKAMLTGVTMPSDAQILAKVKVNDWIDGGGAGSLHRVGVGLCTNATTGMGYNLIFHDSHSKITFLDDGVAWGPSYTFNWTSNTWYWFKLKSVGGTLYGKVWADGSTEPTTWPYTWTRSGRTGVAALHSGSVNSCAASFDDVTVSDLNQAPTCSLTSPAADASFVVPATVSLTANASDSDGTISKVEFYQGSTLLGTDSTSPYSYSWTNMAAGTYSLTAKAYDNSTGVTTSDAVSIIVIGSELPVTNGLQLWLKADAITGLSDGAAVASWPDSSGLARHATQTTGSYQPIYKTNIQNRKPVVRFDGTNDSMTFPRQTTIRTVFWVAKEDSDATTNWRSLLGDPNGCPFMRGGSKQIWDAGYADATVRNGVTRVNHTVVTGTSTTMPTTMSYLTLRTTGNTYASQLTQDRSYTDRVWDGDIAEVIIYDRALSDTEIGYVETYLTNKYGL